MKPIPSQYRRFVLDRAPRFARAVTAARDHGEAAKTTLHQFRDDPFLLYAALWYADSEGVAVTLTPTPQNALSAA